MADSSGPLIPAEQSLPELTFKVFVLGILLAALLAASNIYLALKLGVTIAASIPASVIAIGVLRFFRRSNVLESNIVQTCASAGEGVAAAISFVLPAMILLRLWNHFPYWETVCITLLGGILGVFYSVPLRRVLLNLPNLRFPEGTAIGNVLRASASGKGQLKLLIQGGSTAGLITFLQTGLKILSSNIQTWTVSNSLVFGMGWGLTPATLAAGYIVGFEVAVSLAVGLAVGWLIILPWLGVHYGWVSRLHNPYLIAQSLWSSKLRYVGVGVMLVGGIWTLFRLLKPLVEGLKISFRAAGKNELMDVAIRLRTDRDMPLGYLATLLSLMAVLVYSYAVYFLKINDIVSATSFIYYLAFFTLVYILAAGFFVSVICGYFTGLVGSSNNPLSGVLLISILLLGSIFLLFFNFSDPAELNRVVSLVIVITAIVAGAGAIANENLQDLKAGQMVGATPWKQQVILLVGVVVSALVVGPTLNLLFKAYGIGGVYPHAGMDPTQMLAAPQAGLIEAVAKGLLTRQLDWSMINLGIACGVVFVIIDEVLRRRNFRLACLAAGLGIYLPPEVIMPFVIGGIVSYFVKRNRKTNHKRSAQDGLLLACGLVAGNSLMGVLLAIPFVLVGSADALAVVSKGFVPYANVLGVAAFLTLMVWLYRTGRSN